MLAPFVLAGRGGAAPEVVRITGPTMGTSFAVTIVTEREAAKVKGLDARIAGRLAELNQRFSTYDPGSELSRFNDLSPGATLEVTAETARVTQYALGLAEETGGAFDPTVGPLVNLWGFGPAEQQSRLPPDDAIAAAAERVGYSNVTVSETPPALQKGPLESVLDLSAVAKGYGVDAIAELLESRGFEHFMVEVGGEVRARGRRVDRPWRVGVEKADAPPAGSAEDRMQKVVALWDQALATSGDYRNFFEIEGRRYSHTIDPRTGRPVEHNLATVTVLADTCREADALATALSVLGPAEGYDWAEARGVAALFVSREPGDRLIETKTHAWDASFAATAESEASP